MRALLALAFGLVLLAGCGGDDLDSYHVVSVVYQNCFRAVQLEQSGEDYCIYDWETRAVTYRLTCLAKKVSLLGKYYDCYPAFSPRGSSAWWSTGPHRVTVPTPDWPNDVASFLMSNFDIAQYWSFDVYGPRG